MKKILIPTDFSDCAAHAVNYGLELAKRLNTGIHFLHLIATPVEWDKLPKDKEMFYPQTKAAIGAAKDELLKLERRAEKNGLEVTSELIYNMGIGNLDSYINKEKYDLVVMGTHGVHGFKKIIGSNTQRLIKNSPIPVLAIKEDVAHITPTKIVIASDFNERSMKSFDKLMDLVLLLDLEIELLYVNVPYNFHESDEIEKMMNHFIEAFPDTNFKKQVVSANNVTRGIGIFLKKDRPDIIACITHGYTGILNIFSAGITENLMNLFNLPVLSISIGS